jgi:diadenosine tetraphosphate (Ap4A) HIT family hydrolase
MLLQALSRAVQKATGCSGVRVRQNNGPAAGQVVPQLHFHVIPVDSPEDEVSSEHFAAASTLKRTRWVFNRREAAIIFDSACVTRALLLARSCRSCTFTWSHW